MDDFEKRQQIFDVIETTLLDIGIIRTVTRGTADPADRNAQWALPMASIVPKIDDYEEASKTHSTSDLELFIRVTVDKTSANVLADINAVLCPIYRAMRADRTLGGFAKHLYQKETQWLFFDPVFPQAGADVRYLIHYEL